MLTLVPLLAIVAGACFAPGTAEPTPEPTTSAPSSSSAGSTTTATLPPTASTVRAGTDLGLIVLPDDDGAYPADLLVSCGGETFPFGALDAIAPVPADDPGSLLAAIEPFLASEEGQFWPQDGWHTLHEGSSEATLVARTPGGLAFMSLSRSGTSWAWSGSSVGEGCDLAVATPGDVNDVDWRLDPAAPVPGPESTELRLLLTERQCVSGGAIGDRLLGPEVVMTEEAVYVAFAAKPPPGDYHTCPGNPDLALVVTLPQPLGSRALIEGTSLGASLEDLIP